MAKAAAAAAAVTAAAAAVVKVAAAVPTNSRNRSGSLSRKSLGLTIDQDHPVAIVLGVGSLLRVLVRDTDTAVSTNVRYR